MSIWLEGGCACGSIRFRITQPPVMVAHCHCRDCQKMTGAQMATVAIVPADGFALSQGEARAYVTIGDSGGKVYRSFCPECGSSLFCTSEASPGVYIVEAGSLDDASGLRPTAHLYTSRAQPWAQIPAEMPQYVRMPASR
jgi:hypothetical protein